MSMSINSSREIGSGIYKRRRTCSWVTHSSSLLRDLVTGSSGTNFQILGPGRVASSWPLTAGRHHVKRPVAPLAVVLLTLRHRWRLNINKQQFDTKMHKFGYLIVEAFGDAQLNMQQNGFPESIVILAHKCFSWARHYPTSSPYYFFILLFRSFNLQAATLRYSNCFHSFIGVWVKRDEMADLDTSSKKAGCHLTI